MSFSNLPRPASTTIIPVELAKDIIQIETEVFRSQLKITPLKIDIQRFLKTDKIVHREDSLIRKEAAFKLFMTAVSVALVTLVVLSIISSPTLPLAICFSVVMPLGAIYPQLCDLFHRNLYFDLGAHSCGKLKKAQVVLWPFLGALIGLWGSKNALLELIFAKKSSSFLCLDKEFKAQLIALNTRYTEILKSPQSLPVDLQKRFEKLSLQLISLEK